jgi:p24 family protein alpha
MAYRFYLCIIVIVLQLITPLSSLYFYIRETDRKCFIEEIPDQTLVIGKYKVELFDATSNTYLPSTPGIGMHVEVKDPEEKIVLSKLYTSEGRFSFTSHSPGEHVICLYSNSTAWFGGQQLVSDCRR